MVYDVNGDVVGSLYDVGGDEINTAYDVGGDVVYNGSAPQRDYDNYTISSMFSLTGNKMQSFAVYGGKIAQVRETYALYIIDIATQTKTKEVTMDMGHGNSCQFSDEFYDQEDEFPLFYVRNSGVWSYRITGTTSTLIKKYAFSSNIIGTYVAGFGIDCENRKFYTASYTTGDYETKTGEMRICVWDMDDLTDNGDDTYSMALLDTNDFSWFDNYEAIQGCCFHDGYFFISTGLPGTSQYVVLVSPSTLTIDHVVSLATTTETEGCAWVNDDYMIVGQNPSAIVYSKVEFATV